MRRCAMSVSKARSDLANEVKKIKKVGGDPSAPSVQDARRVLAAEKLAAAIRQTVESAPELTPAMKDRLAALLKGGA